MTCIHASPSQFPLRLLAAVSSPDEGCLEGRHDPMVPVHIPVPDTLKCRSGLIQRCNFYALIPRSALEHEMERSSPGDKKSRKTWEGHQPTELRRIGCGTNEVAEFGMPNARK
jgi:hypothetical protein